MAKKDLKQLIESGICGEMPAGLGDTVYICRANKNGIDESTKIAIDLKEAANNDGQASNPFNPLDTILHPIIDREGKENIRLINEAMNKQPMMLYMPKMTDKGVVYHKVAEGKGIVLPSDKPNELDILNLREKMAIPKTPFPKEMPELSFRVKISKCRLRRLRQMAMGKNPRLPRKLKKAARHADFDMFDLNTKIDALSDRDRVNCTIEYDMRVRIHPEGYPRTKWVQRLAKVVRRITAHQHRRFIKQQMWEQFLNQYPGMLTYNPPSNPAQHHKDLYAGSELVLDKNQQQCLANILNQKEK